MNDKELADRIVALGVGCSYDFPDRGYMYGLDGLFGPDDEQQYPSAFVRDWRVAGALMEKHGNGFTYLLVVDKWFIYDHDDCGNEVCVAKNESLPRAICEACVAALEGGDEGPD